MYGMMVFVGKKVDADAFRLVWQELQPFGTCPLSYLAIMHGTSIPSQRTPEVKTSRLAPGLPSILVRGMWLHWFLGFCLYCLTNGPPTVDSLA